MVRVDPTDQRRVYLDRFGLDARNAGEPDVSGAEVVHRQAEPQIARRPGTVPDVAEPVEGGPLRNLQDDSRCNARQRRRRRSERLIETSCACRLTKKTSPSFPCKLNSARRFSKTRESALALMCKRTCNTSALGRSLWTS